MKRSLRRWATLLALAMLLPACAMMALGLKKPEVQVAGMELLGGNFFEQKFRLTLRVTNPNEKDIAIEGMSFKLQLAGQDFATGVSGQPLVLARLADTQVQVEGHATLGKLLPQLPRMMDRGKLDYRISGDVITRDYGRLPFDRQGDVSAESLGKRFGVPPDGQ